jgi:hypothetical protein
MITERPKPDKRPGRAARLPWSWRFALRVRGKRSRNLVPYASETSDGRTVRADRSRGSFAREGKWN